MAVNTDPKPGRWILPLVILGMIAFTYFFVREIDAASSDSTLAAGPGVTTTTLGDGVTTTTLAPGTDLDPETQAYLDALDAIDADLQLQRGELETVNGLFDQDPRGVEFSEAETRFEAVVTATQTLSTDLAALTVPLGLESNHTTLQTHIDAAVSAAGEALAGLRSTDTGEQRAAGVAAYVTAATDFNTEVTNTKNAAS